MRAQVIDHVRKAALNASRANLYEQTWPADADWAIVLRFYSAVHLADAYFLVKGVPSYHFDDHQTRWKTIRSTGLSQAFRDAYSSLKSVSESVRYTGAFVATKQQMADSVANLADVRKEVEPVINAWLAKNP